MQNIAQSRAQTIAPKKNIKTVDSSYCLNSLFNYLDTPQYFDLELDIIRATSKVDSSFLRDFVAGKDWTEKELKLFNEGRFAECAALFEGGLPPFTNRGGIQDNQQLKPAPPHSTFYTSPLVPLYGSTVLVCVDYLSMTFKMREVKDYYIKKYGSVDQYVDQIKSPLSNADDVVIRLFLDDFAEIVSDFNYSDAAGGLHGYKKSGYMMRGLTQAGRYGYHGCSDTILISFSGQGTSFVDMHKMRAFVSKFVVKITRLDLAYDDLEGNYSYGFWRGKALSNAFYCGKGSAPHVRFIESNGLKGNTIYVGNLDNGKEICIYEKGKQLGDPSSPWVRVEGRLRSIDRVIPLDAITSPSAYFLGMSPVFSCISNQPGAKKIDVVKKTLKTTFDDMAKHAKVGYGKFIYAAVFAWGMCPQEIVDMLMGDGLPKRLIQVSY